MTSNGGWARIGWAALGAVLAAVVGLWAAELWSARQEGIKLLNDQKIERSLYAVRTTGKIEDLGRRLAEVERRIDELERQHQSQPR